MLIIISWRVWVKLTCRKCRTCLLQILALLLHINELQVTNKGETSLIIVAANCGLEPMMFFFGSQGKCGGGWRGWWGAKSGGKDYRKREDDFEKVVRKTALRSDLLVGFGQNASVDWVFGWIGAIGLTRSWLTGQLVVSDPKPGLCRCSLFDFKKWVEQGDL